MANVADMQLCLASMRDALLELEAVGPAGFEGLVATALADLSGLTFRLAKSGSQFGRDASTARGIFSIGMEAKRYEKAPRLEVLAGKAWVASQELASEIDLWVLCATAEIGEGDLRKIAETLEERGISLLTLDWGTSSLPELAVLLAAARERILRWCGNHTSLAISSAIDAGTLIIRSDPSFPIIRDRLLRALTSDYVGLDALAHSNINWCNRIFTDRLASQRTIGQYLAVSDPEYSAIARGELEAAILSALQSTYAGPHCIAVLGAEGVGKSWLFARSWMALEHKPILIIGSAKTANLINPKEPIDTLASLIASQVGICSAETTKRWSRRLLRWRDRPSENFEGTPRFLVVLDGLNEQSGMAWAECIVNLSIELTRLNGRLLVTCREQYWQREVLPRLVGVKLSPIVVHEYTDSELNKLLRCHNVPVETIAADVRVFMRNPRICSLAIDFLDRLAAQADELTIERLLLEYWRRRLEERGDLVAHNITDFQKLLRSHAKAFRENPNIEFDRDEWRTHSGAVRRNDGRSVENDLTDIEEGAFLQIIEGREGFYKFKLEAVPFALGLLIARELQDGLRLKKTSAAELISGIVEEVQGFDLVGEALRAAVGISCFEDRYPLDGCVALISAWLDLQNIPESAYESLAAYTAARPDAIVDAAEAAFDERANIRRRQWLCEALIDKRDNHSVFPILEKRVRKWLGIWSRVPRRFNRTDEEEDARATAHVSYVSECLSSFCSTEKSIFDQVCHEASSSEAMGLDLVAALFIANRPQAAYSENIVAWAFATAITHDLFRATDELCWAVRLNSTDFIELERKVLGIINELKPESMSDTGRRASAIALRLIGSAKTSSKAESLSPAEPSIYWRAVERYCASDPFDPSSVCPPNIVNAVAEADTISSEMTWLYMETANKDLQLEWITPALARFRPKVIVSFLRKVARSAATRSGLQLRQLGWRLPSLSPLFDAETIAAVRESYRRIITEDNPSDRVYRYLVPGQILLSLLPHYGAREQLSLYLALPAEVKDWLTLRDLFSALTPSDLEEALVEAEKCPVRLRRVLFFASANGSSLTDVARQVLERALRSSDPLVVTYSSEVAVVAQDRFLDESVVAAAWRKPEAPEKAIHFSWRNRAVASAIVSLKNYADFSLVRPNFIGFVATHLGGIFDELLLAELRHTFTRLLNPIKTPDFKIGRLSIEINQEGGEVSKLIEEKMSLADELKDRFSSSGNQKTAEASIERRQALYGELEKYLERLSQEDAQALAREPNIAALRHAYKLNPNEVKHWIDKICAESDPKKLSAIRNLALGISIAIDSAEPDLSVILLKKLKNIDSPINILLGHARTPLYFAALFSGEATDERSALREEALAGALSDDELEALVFSAEAAGQTAWLQRWQQREIDSEISGKVARALMVDGLRDRESFSGSFLIEDWGSGFLGEVAAYARTASNKNAWTRQWYRKAMESEDPIEFWRWSEMAIGIADIRIFRWFDFNAGTPIAQKFIRNFFSRAKKAAQDRTSKRRDKLFGLKRPTDEISKILAMK